jgi:tripartite-type tricarboxylate transporter receptor subunit TctC
MTIRWSTLALLLISLMAADTLAAETRYPERPIHVVVGFPAGSAVDAAARLIAPKLAEVLGEPVLIDNVLGAAGNIASDRVVKAPADGYTLALVANAQIITNPSLYHLPYDPLRAFAPISELVASPNLLVVPQASPAKTFRDLIELARSQPGALTYATGGVGSSPHMAAALLSSRAGLDIRHVPYKGVVAALPDLLGERLTMMFSPASIVLPAVVAGRLRALATTSLNRTSLLPDVPTVSESGLPGFDVTVWLGLLAPAGTPSAILDRLHRATVEILETKEIRHKLGDLGMEVIGDSPEEFAATIKSEIPFWADVIKRSGIRPE